MKILESQRNHFPVWPNTIRRIKKFAQKSTMEIFSERFVLNVRITDKLMLEDISS